jgi:hypothetical protein
VSGFSRTVVDEQIFNSSIIGGEGLRDDAQILDEHVVRGSTPFGIGRP